MRRVMVYLLVFHLLTVATAALAQPSGMSHRLEITPFGGYSWTFARSACFGATCGNVDVKSSGFWGLAVDVNGLVPGFGGCYTTVGGYGIGQIDVSAGLSILL